MGVDRDCLCTSQMDREIEKERVKYRELPVRKRAFRRHFYFISAENLPSDGTSSGGSSLRRTRSSIPRFSPD